MMESDKGCRVSDFEEITRRLPNEEPEFREIAKRLIRKLKRDKKKEQGSRGATANHKPVCRCNDNAPIIRHL
jgi:hypothetical protein